MYRLLLVGFILRDRRFFGGGIISRQFILLGFRVFLGGRRLLQLFNQRFVNLGTGADFVLLHPQGTGNGGNTCQNQNDRQNSGHRKATLGMLMLGHT